MDREIRQEIRQRSKRYNAPIDWLSNMKWSLLRLLVLGSFAAMTCAVILGILFYFNHSYGLVDFGSSSVTADDADINSGYLNITKDMYVWGAYTDSTRLGVTSRTALVKNYNGIATKLADFSVMHGMDNLLVYVGCCEWDGSTFTKGSIPLHDDFVAFNAPFIENGIGVTALVYINDDVEDISSPCLDNIITAIKQFNDANPSSAFSGVHIDQEPSSIVSMAALITTLKASHNIAKMNGIQLSSSSKPRYVTDSLTINGTRSTMLEHLATSVDEVTLLAYYNNAEKVAELVRNAASQDIGPFKIALETGYVNAESTETFYDQIRSIPSSWFNTFAGVRSSVESAVGCSVEETSCAVDKFVIHDFVQYWEAIYGTEPYTDDADHGWL
ncbi:hypothetical protein J8273_2643 [Carpediemonas membranifera]|uniref:Uncharacterized protein n=1 Tax=Carpediemonas membranifera TaxID=201153 RepID=A0A8J6BZP7_9EUKA|nr:hypothetical protein J8273_2643 [Carpediemonas membranifera]|eukprot:KAG9395736.1 hypothetical protein J8273_2643 [Carpediemonas membranifera]